MCSIFCFGTLFPTYVVEKLVDCKIGMCSIEPMVEGCEPNSNSDLSGQKVFNFQAVVFCNESDLRLPRKDVKYMICAC